MRASGLTTSLVAAVALAAGALALASCGSSDEPTGTTTDIYDTTTTETILDTTTTIPAPQTTEVRVVVANGAPKGGIVRETVGKDDRVLLVVKSDVTDHVHLHGYDIMRDVVAGGTARIAFRAALPGRFEVELEDRGVQIAEVTVRP